MAQKSLHPQTNLGFVLLATLFLAGCDALAVLPNGADPGANTIEVAFHLASSSSASLNEISSGDLMAEGGITFSAAVTTPSSRPLESIQVSLNQVSGSGQLTPMNFSNGTNTRSFSSSPLSFPMSDIPSLLAKAVATQNGYGVSLRLTVKAVFGETGGESEPVDFEVPLVYTPGSVSANIEFLDLPGLSDGAVVAKRSAGVELPWIKVTPGNPLLDIDVIEVFFSFRNRQTGVWSSAQYKGGMVAGKIFYLQPGAVASFSGLSAEFVTPSLTALSTWQNYDRLRLQVRVDFDGGVLVSAHDEMVIHLEQDLPAVEGKTFGMLGFLDGSPPALPGDLPNQQWMFWTEEHHGYLDPPLVRTQDNSPGSDFVFFPHGFVPTELQHRQSHQLLIKLDTTGDGVGDHVWQVPQQWVVSAAEQGIDLTPSLGFVDGLPVVQ